MSIKIFSLKWEFNDGKINCWGYDKEGNSYLVIIDDYYPFFYIELGEVLLDKDSLTGEKLWKAVYDKLKYKWKSLHDFFVEKKQLLYYYKKKEERMKIFFKVSFKKLDEMRHCRNYIKKFNLILHDYGRKIGEVKLIPREYEINQVTKFLSERKLDVCSWLEIEAKELKPKRTLLSKEYHCKCRNIKKAEDKSVPIPSILSYDIETYSANHSKFPNANLLSDVITMISCVFKKHGVIKNYCIILKACNPIDDCEVIICQTEEEMIRKFSQLVRVLDPDVITGYNINYFDNAYICKRIGKHDMECPNFGRLTNGKTYFRKSSWSSAAYGRNNLAIFDINGRIVLDLYRTIKDDYKLPSYKLSFVSSHFRIGCNKLDVTAKQMFECYKNLMDNPTDSECIRRQTEIADYCVRDSLLPILLMEKLYTWYSQVEYANVFNVNINVLTESGQQRRVISQLYKFSRDMKLVLHREEPTMGAPTGGHVEMPKIGIHNHVGCWDFTSHYPSILVANNMCYSTFVADPSGIPEEDLNKIDTVKGTFYFHNKVEGLLPAVTRFLLKTRKAVKVQMAELKKKEDFNDEDKITMTILDKKQLALKVGGNSVYGFTGVSKHGLMPMLEIAECITNEGKRLILQTQDEIKKFDPTTKKIYGDTDSAMCQVKASDYKEAFAKCKEIEAYLNDKFQKGIHVELEKVMRILCLTKKKYAYYMSDKTGKFIKDETGKIKIWTKGNVIVRREFNAFVKTLYEKLLRMIMDGKNMLSCVKELVRNVTRLVEGKVPLTDLTMNFEVGAKYKAENYPLNLLKKRRQRIGKPIKGGERVDIVIIDNGEESVGNRYYLLDELEEMKDYKLDYIKYIEKMKKSIDQLFERGFIEEDFYDDVIIELGRNGNTQITPKSPMSYIFYCYINAKEGTSPRDAVEEIIRDMGDEMKH